MLIPVSAEGEKKVVGSDRGDCRMVELDDAEDIDPRIRWMGNPEDILGSISGLPLTDEFAPEEAAAAAAAAAAASRSRRRGRPRFLC